MFQKLKNLNTQLKQLKKKYIDYLICITFLNILIFKINQITFNISGFYLYPIIIILSILFLDQLIRLSYIIKNTYLFSWFLYYFLLLKNNIYATIFLYCDYINHETRKTLLIFLTGFLISSWGLNIIFFLLNQSYDLSFLVVVFLLFISIFNLIESKLIFNDKDLNLNYSNFDFKVVKNILKINNNTFNKNRSLIYIQKRYINVVEIQNIIKNHGIAIITSATAGSLFAGYIQHTSIKSQERQSEKQLESQERQFEKQLESQERQFEKQLESQERQFEKKLKFQERQFENNIIKQRDDRLAQYDDILFNLNKEKIKLEVDMSRQHFWNKVDHSKQIEELQKEKNSIEKKRKEFMKMQQEYRENKVEIDSNFFLED